jgi:hypothetical protein
VKPRVPRQHIPLRDAAYRLGHKPRWVKKLIESGHLEAFQHGAKDITISLESIVQYEEKVRISGADNLVRGGAADDLAD